MSGRWFFTRKGRETGYSLTSSDTNGHDWTQLPLGLEPRGFQWWAAGFSQGPTSSRHLRSDRLAPGSPYSWAPQGCMCAWAFNKRTVWGPFPSAGVSLMESESHLCPAVSDRNTRRCPALREQGPEQLWCCDPVPHRVTFNKSSSVEQDEERFWD